MHTHLAAESGFQLNFLVPLYQVGVGDGVLHISGVDDIGSDLSDAESTQDETETEVEEGEGESEGESSVGTSAGEGLEVCVCVCVCVCVSQWCSG